MVEKKTAKTGEKEKTEKAADAEVAKAAEEAKVKAPKKRTKQPKAKKAEEAPEKAAEGSAVAVASPPQPPTPPTKKEQEDQLKADREQIKAAKDELRRIRSLRGQDQKKFLRNLKKQVFELEKYNRSRLYAYMSTGNWFKMGGVSALLFTKRIAKRIGSAANLLPDGDFYDRFDDGVVSISDMAALIKKLKEINIRVNEPQSTGGLVIFELGYSVSDEDLKRMREEEEEKRKQLNRMILPNNPVPELHGAIVNMLNAAYTSYQKMSVLDREFVGQALMESLIRIRKLYAVVATGDGRGERALLEMLGEMQSLRNHLYVVNELSLWELKTGLKMSAELMKAEKIAQKQYKTERAKRANGNAK